MASTQTKSKEEESKDGENRKLNRENRKLLLWKRIPKAAKGKNAAGEIARDEGNNSYI